MQFTCVRISLRTRALRRMRFAGGGVVYGGRHQIIADKCARYSLVPAVSAVLQRSWPRDVHWILRSVVHSTDCRLNTVRRYLAGHNSICTCKAKHFTPHLDV